MTVLYCGVWVLLGLIVANDDDRHPGRGSLYWTLIALLSWALGWGPVSVLLPAWCAGYGFACWSHQRR